MSTYAFGAARAARRGTSLRLGTATGSSIETSLSLLMVFFAGAFFRGALPFEAVLLPEALLTVTAGFDGALPKKSVRDLSVAAFFFAGFRAISSSDPLEGLQN
jgi:hypothetical protein